MTRPDHVRLDDSKVVAEVVDDELMVINLATGVYYTSVGTGVEVWRCLEHGYSLGACADHFAAGDGVEVTTAREAVDSFVAELVEEGLVAPSDSPVPSPQPATDPPGPRPDAPWEAPVLERFVDLEKLIQLDPVLEVDEDGWPIAAETS